MTDSMPPLPEWVKPGAVFRYDFGPGNRNTGRKFHVRSLVDGMAVVREWWRHKQRWNYTVYELEYFEAYEKNIKVVK